MIRRAILLLFVLTAAGASFVPLANMNGEYLIANPNIELTSKYSTNYGTKNAEYFDVYSPPITTQYAQVFWLVCHDVKSR